MHVFGQSQRHIRRHSRPPGGASIRASNGSIPALPISRAPSPEPAGPFGGGTPAATLPPTNTASTAVSIFRKWFRRWRKPLQQPRRNPMQACVWRKHLGNQVPERRSLVRVRNRLVFAIPARASFGRDDGARNALARQAAQDHREAFVAFDTAKLRNAENLPKGFCMMMRLPGLCLD